MKIEIKLQPKQIELKRRIEAQDNSWLGYGGARGGAKVLGLGNWLYFMP